MDLDEKTIAPLHTLEELLAENRSLIREKYNLPHPLYKFALRGGIADGVYADVIYDFMFEMAITDAGTREFEAARWFLLHSEKAFYFACSNANIDGTKLRAHLLKCESGGSLETKNNAARNTQGENSDRKLA